MKNRKKVRTGNITIEEKVLKKMLLDNFRLRKKLAKSIKNK